VVSTDHNPSINSCIRCGTCCEKGGPAFHLADRHLIDEGLIHTRHLYTIRQGEMVRDNVRDVVMPSPGEMIKIKGVEGSWQCTFFMEADKTCRIYAHRPEECRILKCWDPAELKAMYDRDRLTRKDLLSDIAGLWDLVEAHERQCSYAGLKHSLSDPGGHFEKTAIKTVVSMVRYDQEVRRLVVSQGGVETDMTDFLFGRPLEKTIEMFGYRVREKDGKFSLVRI
jgi:Fe-S-cluster containining protein